MKLKINTKQIIPIIIIIVSFIGLSVAMELSIDKFNVLKNSNINLPCSINTALDCKSVMNTWQAEVFGFPNMFMGIAGYMAMLTYGVTILITDVKNKFYNLFAYLGVFLAFLFSYWLLSESVYSIGSICIYCVISWLCANTLFYSLTLRVFSEGFIPQLNKLRDKIYSQTFINYYLLGVFLTFLITFSLVYIEFGNALFE